MCEIAKKIYNRRKELGLTLEEVGKAVGVGKSTVRKWENGMIKNMGRDKIAALARILKMDPVELVPGPADFPYDDDEYMARWEKYQMSVARSVPISNDDRDRLEALHQDPRLRMLFDRSRKMSKEDVDFMLQMADRILKEQETDE